jgi:hypothetical protein
MEIIYKINSWFLSMNSPNIYNIIILFAFPIY